MLTKLFRRSPVMGIEHHLPEIRLPLKQLHKADVEPARRLLEPTRNRAWIERYYYSLCMAEVSVDCFEDWCRCEPLSPDPWLLRGRARIAWAWEARTAGRAEDVTEEGWRLFFLRLSLARRDLLWAAERLPADPTPYVHLIRIHMGGGTGTEEIYRLLGEATARLSTHFEAYLAAQLSLAEKWQGSHDEMFGFARASVERAAVDNDLAALMANAHSLRYLHFLQFEKNSQGAGAYLQDRNVQREVAAYFDRFFASKSYREGFASFKAWNEFAYWFYKCEDKRRLRRCLEVIRGRYAGGFWGVYQNPEKILKEVEEMARD